MAGFYDNGRVAVAGFYDDVREPSPAERRYQRRHATPDVRALADVGLRHGWGQSGWTMHERRTLRPALIVNGIRGGDVGEQARSIIPRHAVARVSARLVPDQDPAAVAEALRRHVASAATPGITTRLRVLGGARPVLLPREHPALAAAARAVGRVWEVPPVWTRSGGTIPIVERLYHRFDMPAVLLGFGLPSDGAHAPNEQFYLPNFYRGVETVLHFIAAYAGDQP